MEQDKSLTGKIALITGATSGIGFHTASALAGLGATIYLTGRDARRGQVAEQQLRAIAGHDHVYFISADAATVGGNQALARRVSEQTNRLHILVNNVGGAYNDRWETGDGYEATLAIQAVGPFALTQTLLPLLRRSAPARVVNVASDGYTMWKGDPFADLQSREGYVAWRAYARSKLLNILWTFALARRLEGCGVVANACHPGVAWTSMTEGMAPGSMPSWARLVWPLFRWVQRRGSPAQAARSSIFLASAAEAAMLSGKYVGSNARPANPASVVLDPANQERAWEVLVALTTGASTALREDRVLVGVAAG